MTQKFMHSLIFAAFFLIPDSLLISQTAVEPSRLKQFNITINFDDYTVKTQMLSQNKSICVNNDRVYMWYGSQKIIETRGGYDGKLIHGTYRAFYLNNQLREQGEIRYGLRNKEWKYWYPDGNLKEVIHWKRGAKNGAYYLYNDYGQLMAKGHFRMDKLHGRFYTYTPAGKIADKKRYKRGEEVIVRVKEKQPVKKKTKPEKKPQAAEAEQETAKKPAKEGSFFRRLFKKKKEPRKEKPGRPKKSPPQGSGKKTITTQVFPVCRQMI